jgi:hypothetical protein
VHESASWVKMGSLLEQAGAPPSQRVGQRLVLLLPSSLLEFLVGHLQWP